MGGVLLGCDPVTAVDNDPQAVQAARENFFLNGMDSRIRVFKGTPDDISSSFDIVLANIEALPLRKCASALAGALKKGGRLVLSGILIDQKDEVREAYEGEGMQFLHMRVLGEWCLLVFGREER
jgi:ribosomal protein L11 methyltransferase